MSRYLAACLLFLASCKHTEVNSDIKSLQYFPERNLISTVLLDVSKGEPITLVIDSQTGKPTPDAKLFISSIVLTLADNDKDKVCSRKLLSLNTRGESGVIPYELIDHDEGSSDFYFAYKKSAIPLHYNELIFSFEGKAKFFKSRTCRIKVVADGHWAAEGDIGYSATSDNPKRDQSLRAYASTYGHRLSHYMWHTSRGLWEDLILELEGLQATNKGPSATDETRSRMLVVEKTVAQYKQSGWAPPRYLHADELETSISGAGEDFLYMHHQMLGRVNDYLKSQGFDKIEPWVDLPKPDDKTYTLGPNGHGPLTDMKSDDYFYTRQSLWEKAYKSTVVNADELAQDLLAYRLKHPLKAGEVMTLKEAQLEVKNLLEPRPGIKFTGVKGVSLSEYGHLLEMTIHNNLHMRYAYDSASRPANADPLDKEGWDRDWAKAYDPITYDWLGDTYAAHVNPWFYRIHGWIDARLTTWLEANGFKSIGTQEECVGAAQPCYVWLSDARYKNSGDALPWEGPRIALKASNDQPYGMSLHAHPAPLFSADVIRATRGLRAQHATMSRILLHPALVRD